MNSLEIAVKAIDDKHAKDIEILDMRSVSPLIDYMIICTGNTDRQVEAIVKNVKEEIYLHEMEVRRVEGATTNLWVLVDLNDVIVHVFQEDERVRYNLERLWADVPRVDVEGLLK